MTIVVKNLLILGAGIAIGAVSAIVITKEKNEAILQEELASIKETFEKKKQKIKEDIESMNDELSATREYKKMIKKYSNDGDMDEEDENYRESERMSHDAKHYKSDGTPHVISVDEFSEEKDHYDKVSIYYYEDDDTLADADEEIIEDVRGTIGDEALTNFGNGSGDPEIVYIRNNKLEIDYEVIRLSRSYRETILGPSSNE